MPTNRHRYRDSITTTGRSKLNVWVAVLLVSPSLSGIHEAARGGEAVRGVIGNLM